MNTLEDNLAVINHNIAVACESCGRNVDDVCLVAVSKTKPASAIRDAYALGLRHFAENYLQEAQRKIETCADLDAVWHFIGEIQSNKTQQIAQLFDWVHTVYRPKIAQRLNDQCPPGKQLQLLIQVNIDQDPAKSGAMAETLPALIAHIEALPNLKLRGLMTILAQNNKDPRASFESMAQLLNEHQLSHQTGQKLPLWNSLSMGMTGDMQAAIAAGSTHVRIGTALFGARDRTVERSKENSKSKS